MRPAIARQKKSDRSENIVDSSEKRTVIEDDVVNAGSLMMFSNELRGIYTIAPRVGEAPHGLCWDR
jgi:hypothetical protein